MTREKIYALLAATFFLLAVGMAGGKAIVLNEPFNLVVSDGRFYYAYLPSVWIDGDLDFSNQISEHWGADYRPILLENPHETGLVRNRFPIGMALTLSPAFLLGHVVAILSGGRIKADGYSWPYQLACLALIQLLVWRTLVRIDRLLTERLSIPAGPAFLGVLIVAVGTPYAYYVFREPFMVHAVSTFWCTEVVAAAAAWQRGSGWLWPRLAFYGAMAVVCRPTNIHLVPVAGWAVVHVARGFGSWRAFTRFPLAAVSLIPIGLQLVTWRVLSGSWVHYSYEDRPFFWTRPALLQTLFSSRHGLFFWSPALLIAVAGLARARDPLVRQWSIGGILLWYANSAWSTWWFGDAFGGRAFLELTGLFGIGLGVSFALLRGRPRLTATLVALVVAFNLGLMALYITHRISRDGYIWP